MSRIDSRKAANIDYNRLLLKSIARAILYCGKQCIALQGDREDLSGNYGNFLSLLKILAVHDDVLRGHMETPVIQNVTYMSAQAQNKLIEVMGKHYYSSKHYFSSKHCG